VARRNRGNRGVRTLYPGAADTFIGSLDHQSGLAEGGGHGAVVHVYRRYIHPALHEADKLHPPLLSRLATPWPQSWPAEGVPAASTLQVFYGGTFLVRASLEVLILSQTPARTAFSNLWTSLVLHFCDQRSCHEFCLSAIQMQFDHDVGGGFLENPPFQRVFDALIGLGLPELTR
jgi:hypothetical protein